MDAFITERLESSHRTRPFRCGARSLDIFFSRHALKNQAKDQSVTYVFPKHSAQVEGYYTFAMSHVSHDIVPLEDAMREGPKYFRPTLLLARLAVAKDKQGNGLGKALLRDAMHRFITGAGQFGSSALEVDALDAKTASYYSDLGFIPFLDQPLHLYLPTQTIRQHINKKQLSVR